MRPYKERKSLDGLINRVSRVIFDQLLGSARVYIPGFLIQSFIASLAK